MLDEAATSLAAGSEDFRTGIDRQVLLRRGKSFRRPKCTAGVFFLGDLPLRIASVRQASSSLPRLPTQTELLQNQQVNVQLLSSLLRNRELLCFLRLPCSNFLTLRSTRSGVTCHYSSRCAAAQGFDRPPISPRNQRNGPESTERGFAY